MRKRSILDRDFFVGWDNYVIQEDELLWTGKPRIQQYFRFLEKDFYHDVMTGVSSVVMLYTMLLLAITYGLYELGFQFYGIIIFVLGATIPFLWEYFNYKNRLKTEYAITKKYVLFKIYNGFRNVIHTIPIEDLIKIYLTKEIKDIGTITLITNGSVGFSTYSGRTGLRRDHPTLEFVRDSEKVAKILNTLIANHPRKKLTYQKPIISGWQLKVAKAIYVLIIGFMTIYLADFFLFPPLTLTDQGQLINRNLVDTDYQRGPEDMGGHYKTRLRQSFNTFDYFPELGRDDLELELSPIFKIVKGVKSEKMDYSDRLSSSLNHLITKCAYFLVYFVMLGGFLILRKKQVIDKELFGKVIMSAVGFLGVLYLIWRIHN